MEWLGRNLRTGGIIRVSSYGQEDNTSRITQGKALDAYCQQHGLELVVVFFIVETAKKSELRKKEKAARKWLQENQIRHHAYYKPDRDNRNLTDNERGENDVREDKYVIHYVLDQKVIHKNSPDSDFFQRDITAACNKNYSRDLSTKVRNATRTKAEQGWYPGTHTPLGFMHQKLKDENGCEFRRGTIIVRDPDLKAVRQVIREFELRADGHALHEIRRRIIGENLIPVGKLQNYHISGIEQRLKNVFYDSRFIWQGKEYVGKHERLFPAELFWKVQATLGIKSKYTKRGAGIFGGGWMKCATAECRCHIIYDPKKKTIKKTGKILEFRYYHCTNGKKVHPSMKGMSVVEDRIWDQFTPAVSQISISKGFAGQISAALNETRLKAQAAIKREIGAYEEAIRAAEKREDQIYDRYESGEYDKETKERRISRVREEKRQFVKALEQAQLSINDAGMETAQSILELATNAESLWKMRSPQERKSFLDQLLSNPVLDGTTVRYEIIKPLQTLSEMKEDQEWRRGEDCGSQLITER